MQKFSVGIMVYNESKNIRRLFSAVSEQNLFGFELGEVIVVSSGSNDGTDEAVCGFAKKDKRARLIKQDKRYGKSSAINLFFENVNNQDMILLNGDSIPDTDLFKLRCALSKLLFFIFLVSEVFLKAARRLQDGGIR